ncbi:MAG: hypothetical protein V9E96_14335 [Chitinophagaceae bacterium]
MKSLDIHLIDSIKNKYDAIILSVSHNEFKTLDVKGLLKSSESVLFDTKAFLDRSYCRCKIIKVKIELFR